MREVSERAAVVFLADIYINFPGAAPRSQQEPRAGKPERRFLRDAGETNQRVPSSETSDTLNSSLTLEPTRAHARTHVHTAHRLAHTHMFLPHTQTHTHI